MPPGVGFGRVLIRAPRGLNPVPLLYSRKMDCFKAGQQVLVKEGGVKPGPASKVGEIDT